MLPYFFSLLGLYLLGVGFATLKIYVLKKQGFNHYGYRTALNPVKWFNFLVGYILKFLMPPHIIEQMAIRLNDDECLPECYNSKYGNCKYCGCNALAKAYSPLEQCSNANWGPIIFDKKEYEKFRKEYPVTIIIKYIGKQELF